MSDRDDPGIEGNGHSAERLCAAVRRLHARGWCLGTGGNFSVVTGSDPLRLLITRSGCDKGDLTPDDLVVVDAEASTAEGSSARPSAEARVHAASVRSTGAGSVLHTHSVFSTLLGERGLDRGGLVLTGYEMLIGLEGVESHEARVFVPILPNSQNMVAFGAEVARLLRDHPGARGFLVAGHGLYTWGRTIEDARRHVEIFEFLFECVARRTAFEPRDSGR